MMPEPTSILAFRNGSIGNTLAAVPALRALRQRYPRSTLSVVVDPVGYQLLEHCPWIDHLVPYDKRGQHRSFAAQAAIVNQLRRLRPSHAVLFKRFFRNGLLAFLSGAKVRSGFVTESKAPFLTHTIPYDETVNVVDLNLRLAALLDAPSDDRRLELFLTEADRATARDLVGDAPYVAVHYGGQTTAPDFFPAQYLASLLQTIATRKEHIVFIGSGNAETAQARNLARQVNGTVATNLPVRVAAAVIERANLFAGFNSGPAHIAAAVGTPEIVFFRPDDRTETELRKWSPVSDISRTFVPPRASSEPDWSAFLNRVADAARELLLTRDEMHVR